MATGTRGAWVACEQLSSAIDIALQRQHRLNVLDFIVALRTIDR